MELLKVLQDLIFLSSEVCSLENEIKSQNISMFLENNIIVSKLCPMDYYANSFIHLGGW
jgi:hypothetical protein